MDHVTGDLSMLLTVAVVEPVRSYSSVKVKVNDPLPVNTYTADHELFVIVIHVLLNPVKVAVTLLCVGDVVEYWIVAAG